MNDNYLLDQKFLTELSLQKEREIYVRITALDFNENPLDLIEGKVTGGSINIDGTSSVRRTCSLTLITKDVNINDFYWGVKTKFKLELGLKNKISLNYPEIIWFSQGYYLISTFNTSVSTNNCTISLQGKDKMCLLNGELGGQLYASVDFGAEETIIEKMEEVQDTLESNSEIILSKDYYIKITASQNLQEDLQKNPSQYKILVDKKEGNFCKENNTYRQIQQNEEVIKKYSIYKKISEPNEIFESINNETFSYEANKYYYQKYLQEDPQENPQYYYILDTRSSASEGTIYFELKKLYKYFSTIKKEKIPVEKIIREAIHAYAKEPYHNIIINDLDIYGLDQLTYKGDIPLYAIYSKSEQDFTDIYLSNNLPTELNTFITNLGGNFYFLSLNNLTNNDSTATWYDQNNDEYSVSDTGDKAIVEIKNNDDIGYHLTNLVYPDDLITNIGDTLTSVLDKIKNMLGEFEYFYDINGRFIFQKKKNYVQTSWNQIVQNDNQLYIDNNKSKFSFNFEGNILISAIQNSPALNNLRNDFSVWGKRKGLSEADIPIHMRYAIDKKPVYYKALDGKVYFTNTDRKKSSFLKDNKNWWNFTDFIDFLNEYSLIEFNQDNTVQNIFLKYSGLTSGQFEQIISLNNSSIPTNLNNIRFFEFKENNNLIYISSGSHLISEYYDSKNYYIYIPATSLKEILKEVDWREIIYQMALDYFAGQGCSNDNPVILSNSENYLTDPDQFLYEVGKRNPEYYPTGYTGYEQYYTDMQGFWRQLYNPDYIPELVYKKGFYQDSVVELGANSGTFKKEKQWMSSSLQDYNIEYYVNKNNKTIINQGNIIQNSDNDEIKKKYSDYVVDFTNSEKENRLYWNHLIFEDPQQLNFWIDFLDSDTELASYTISQIGDRSKTVNEDKAKVISYPEIPKFIFYEKENSESEEENPYQLNNTQIDLEVVKNSGYTLIQIPSGFSQFFTVSSKNLSVKDKIDSLLYQHAYCIENISLTSIPIYHLEPNTRILVYDKETNINGEYIVTRFTIPLSYNGTMSITANKAPERIY